MRDHLSAFWVHTVLLEPYTGTTGYGEALYEEPVAAQVWIDDKRRLVRNEQGEQVISETALYGPLEGPLAGVGPHSRVTLPASFGTRQTAVLAASRYDDNGALGLPNHIELALA